jgi:hypothetical protein
MVQVDVFWSYAIGSSFALAAFRQLRKLRVENDLKRWELGWKKGPGVEPPVAGDVEVQPPELTTKERMQFDQLVKELQDNGIKPGRLSLKDIKEFRRITKAWMEEYSVAFNNPYFLKTLLFLSLLFVPSGSVLLWSNANWETMQVGSYETIPAWLVGGFTTTNVTQGILGFWVTYDLLMKGKYYQAALQPVWSYMAFFFILVNGWDNQGYRRFFSRNREYYDNWKWTNIFSWATSDVVRILLAYGGAFLPLMYYWIIDWLIEGYDMEAGVEDAPDLMDRVPEVSKLMAQLNTVIFGGTLGTAIASTVLIRNLGWIKGLAATAAISYPMISKRGLGTYFCKKIMKVDDLEGIPIEEITRQAIEAKRPAMVTS